MNEYTYTLDPYSDEPIMLVYGTIGEDVLGDLFTKELMLIDSQGKKRIQVWVNSGGGDCQNGEQIFAAILKSKTQVDTYNIGMAASIAGPIFLAGKNRYMMSNAKFMMHPVSGGDVKARQAFEESVKTMISQRSVLTPEKTQELINATTWLNAKECHDLGICTEVEDISTLNLVEVNSVPKGVYSNYTKIFNEVNQNKMIKVANFLNLNPASNNLEDAIISEVTKLKNEANEASDKLNKFMDEYNAAKKAKEETESRFLDMQDKYNKLVAENEAANRVAAENKAKSVVGEAVKLGKIENKAETIKTWEEKFVTDPTGTETLINSIPAKVVGANFDVIKDLGTPKTFNAVDVMNKVKSNTKNK